MRNKKIFSEGIVAELRKVPVFRYFFRKGKKNAKTLPKEHTLINLMRFFVFEGSPVTRAGVLFYPGGVPGEPHSKHKPKDKSCVFDYCDVSLTKSSTMFWWEAATPGSKEFKYFSELERDINRLEVLYSYSQWDVLEDGGIGDASGFENNAMLWLEIPRLPEIEVLKNGQGPDLEESLLIKKGLL